VEAVQGWAPEPGPPILACWLGRIEYRAAWALQKRLAAARGAGLLPDILLLLEHDAVLTLGRGADPRHVLATPAELARRRIETIAVERGGEVTYHGPGQLVAYPIVRLADRGLLLRPFVRSLEAALVAVCAAHGVAAARRDGHPGCWCDPASPGPRKIGALGLRIERGVSYHGIALNVDPDLRDFDLIDPCGMPGVVSTSIAAELGRPGEAPSTAAVERAGRRFAEAFATEIGAALAWADDADLGRLVSGVPLPSEAPLPSDAPPPSDESMPAAAAMPAAGAGRR
jgi:lipoyl(octanoyl) transferase